MSRYFKGLTSGTLSQGLEEMIFDNRTGVLLNGSTLEYKPPTILDTPAINRILIESRTGTACYKGGGVSHCIMERGMIACAVHNAIGRWMTSKKRNINAQDFWAVKIPHSTVLTPDEIVTEIQIPAPATGSKSAFLKFALRKSIDFPIVNCAGIISIDASAFGRFPHKLFFCSGQ